MKKMFFSIFPLAISMTLFGQNAKTNLLENSFQLIHDRLSAINRQGYEIKAINYANKPSSVQLEGYDIYEKDTVFIEAYSFLKKRDYFDYENALLIFRKAKNFIANQESKSTLVTNKSSFKSEIDRTSTIIDSWKTWFMPQINTDPNFLNTYNIYLNFEYMPVVDQGVRIEGAKRKNTNESKGFVIIVYSR